MKNEAMEIMENVVTEAIVEDAAVEPMAATNEVQTVGGNNPVIRGIVIGGVILAAFLWTRKDKIEESITNHRIKKLEKAGYTVIRNEDIVIENCEVCDEEVAD